MLVRRCVHSLFISWEDHEDQAKAGENGEEGRLGKVMMTTLGCGQIGAGILVNPTEYAIYF